MRKLLLLAALVVLAACDRTTWHDFRAPDGSFTAKFPGTPPRELRRSTSRVWMSFDNRTQFVLQVFAGPDYAAANAATVLRDYPNPGAAGIEGNVVEASAVQAGPLQGRSVRMEGFAGPQRVPVVQLARAFVADGRLYLLSVNAGKGNIDTRLAKRFFNSFQPLR